MIPNVPQFSSTPAGFILLKADQAAVWCWLRIASVRLKGSPQRMQRGSGISASGFPRLEALNSTASLRLPLLRATFGLQCLASSPSASFPSGQETGFETGAPKYSCAGRSVPSVLRPADFADLVGLPRSFRGLSPSQFAVSEVFSSLQDAVSRGSGWVDLFSGSRGFAKGLSRAAPWWILCFDVARSSAEDLLEPGVQQQVKDVLQSGQVRGLSAGPVCSSFSSALTPHWRTAEHPEGLPTASCEQRRKLQRGNDFLQLCFDLLEICVAEDLLYFVENSETSRFWFQPGWAKLDLGPSSGDFVTDFCVWGTPWRKATRFRTNSSLRGCKLRCACQ